MFLTSCRKRTVVESGRPELLLFACQSKTTVSRSNLVLVAAFGVVTELTRATVGGFNRAESPNDPDRSNSRVEAGAKGAKPAAKAAEFGRWQTMSTALVPDARVRWHVLWTRSHCEQMVHDQLAGKEFDLFLPKCEAWERRSGTRRLSGTPLFPGYLFLRHALDKQSYIEVRKARGLVSILGDGWERPASLPDSEINAIRRMVGAKVPAVAHPYLKEGRRVRITRGSLAGLEGILVQLKMNQGLLVLSLNLLQRSVAVEVDCTAVEPVAASRWEAGMRTPRAAPARTAL
jgi:transcription antitermination factor NusG